MTEDSNKKLTAASDTNASPPPSDPPIVDEVVTAVTEPETQIQETLATKSSPSKEASTSDASSPATTEASLLEKLVMANIEERRQQRRSKNIGRALWLVIFLVAIWALFGRGCTSKSAAVAQHTAVIEIKGEIAAGADASAENIIPALRSAFEESSAQAVVLLINSPGGSPVQAGIINDEVMRLKVLHKKPVYAVVEETCASAAYYIAVSADKIFVDKASIVGSIGVLMDGFGFTGLMDKLGVERRLMTAGENKGFLDPFSPQTAPHKAYAQTMLNQVHQQFIEVVKNGRGLRLKESPETFSGLFWSGQQAVELGLADELKSLDAVAREVVKAEEIIDYTLRENVAERLVKRFGAAVGEGAMRAAKSQFELK
jgi:protease IV